MFTGIIEYVVPVEQFSQEGGCYKLVIPSPFPADSIEIGESIALNGVCLTVRSIESRNLVFDVQQETISRTYFAALKRGDLLNVERALAAGGRFGGHIVQGHIDTVGSVVDNTKTTGDWVLEINAPGSFLQHVVQKGSVAIDGVSLTVVEKRTSSFTVHLVPHTLAHTNLKFRKKYDSVNLEADILAKYVHNYLSNMAETSDQAVWNALQKGGFIQ